MRVMLLASVVLSALAASSRADVDVSAQNGDAVTGTLSPATEVETFRVVAPAGAALTVKAKAAKAGPSLHVRILDFKDGVVAENVGKTVTLKAVGLPASGEYRIEVSSQDGTTAGDYSLGISWRSPTSFGGPVTIPPAGTADIPFAAENAAKLTLSVKPAKRSTATPALVHLARPDATFDILTGTKATAFASPTGDHVLRVGDAAAGGAVVATVKVKPQKVVKRKLRLDARSVPADGAVLVAGLVTPLAGGGAGVGAGPLAGAQVSVPPGAVGSPTAVLVGTGAGIAPADIGVNLAGPAILVGPEGLAFRGGKTATVTIPFDPAAFPNGTAGLRVFTRSAAGIVTEVTGLTIDDGRHVVSFPAAHFSVFQVFAPSGAAQVAKLQPTDLVGSDLFGLSLDVSGDYAVVGTSIPVVGGFPNVGAVYVFQRVGTVWSQIQKLVPDSPKPGDKFGFAVAIHGDTIAVGAPGRDVAASDAGAVFVYVRSGSTFSKQAEFSPSAGQSEDAFGSSVALRSDTIVASAPGDDGAGSDAGTAYVYLRSGTQWTEVQEIRPVALTAGQSYGHDVAVSGDRLVVGAPMAPSAVPQSGAAYVWVLGGATWTEEQKLVSLKPETGDNFGWSVAIDGPTIVAGARLRRGVAPFQGAAFVFVRGAQTWTQEQEVVSVDGTGDDQFGESVALEGDVLVAGALFKSLPNAHFGGAAYAFTRAAGVWTQRARLTASDAAPEDTFGFPVALSSKAILVGAYQKDRGTELDVGAAYVFGFSP